jgi:hypothetical protein
MALSKSGFPASSTKALGFELVYGLRRVPKPAANIIAFNIISVISEQRSVNSDQ